MSGDAKNPKVLHQWNVVEQSFINPRPDGGGGPKGHPLWFFVDNPKTAANFAAPFSVHLRTSISRIPRKIGSYVILGHEL